MILTYLIILLIIFLGLYIGLLVGYLAQEELKPGKNYLNLLRHLLFIAIIVIFFVKNWSVLFVIMIAALIIIFSFSRYRETLYYYALAVIFFLAWHFNGITLIALLIFLYGFPVGSIYLCDHIKDKKNIKKIVLGMLYDYVGFFGLGVLLGLIGLLL
ncbi:hypothetical protein AYK26_01300 [Euryarchaeota archaeon SM23-78]|nr:MAG: hypothetical protein AYK26_01300 [Euryarchaeota archaeon SM23-78]MBW3000631.1 hypothetical protein [Candidatus Woesearchaeota archaeon]